MKKSSYTQAKGSREKDKRYNQLLVIRDNYPRTNIRQVSWLTDQQISAPSQEETASMSPIGSRLLLNGPCSILPAHSDRIVQDFHLIPFNSRNRCLLADTVNGLYSFPVL